jgi:hypothetical protein
VTTGGNGSAVIGLLTGCFALLFGLVSIGVGVAWAAGTFGDHPNWLIAILCLVLGAVALLAGIGGLSFAWRTYRG